MAPSEICNLYFLCLRLSFWEIYCCHQDGRGQNLFTSISVMHREVSDIIKCHPNMFLLHLAYRLTEKDYFLTEDQWRDHLNQQFCVQALYGQGGQTGRVAIKSTGEKSGFCVLPHFKRSKNQLAANQRVTLSLDNIPYGIRKNPWASTDKTWNIHSILQSVRNYYIPSHQKKKKQRSSCYGSHKQIWNWVVQNFRNWFYFKGKLLSQTVQ